MTPCLTLTLAVGDLMFALDQWPSTKKRGCASTCELTDAGSVGSPGYFDKKAWSREYMREYMRMVRAKQKLERERNDAVNAAMARLSNRAPATDLSVTDRLARSEAIMADMELVLEEVKRRVVEAGVNGPKPAQRR
jgi:hypothetical protein